MADALARGHVGSARDHYQRAGRREARLDRSEYRQHLARVRGVQAPELPASPRIEVPAISIEAVSLSQSGAMFIAGWADDRQQPLTAVTARIGRGMQWNWTSFPRIRRPDVEAVVHSSRPYQFGFWVVGQAEGASPAGYAGSECSVELRFATGTAVSGTRVPTLCPDVTLRDMAMEYLANAAAYGNRFAEGFANLDRQAGDWLIAMSRAIGRSIAAGASVTRFGPQRPRYRGSIIVPLYGIGDFLFVQNCLYAQGRGISDYEFIYVVNSPELAEQLHREARIAEMIYGLSVSLVVLPDNAGFGPANNLALQFARSDRILCVNPDVFPRDADWAQRHTDLVAGLPQEQTRLFGTSLFYDDGSLMHGGMYFEAEPGLLAGPSRIAQRPLLRVEHYGKGAPAWARQYVQSRPVPAVTGAFMSIDRVWFEKLGGFTEDYVFGHYEDADLCLKSLQAGTPVWLHDIPMWHLEGKGSRRRPAHEGGSLLNRWLFTRSWASSIMPDLLGRTPRLRLKPPAAAATPSHGAAAASRASSRPARLRSV